MTETEALVIVGGLVLGYWIVAVLLPALERDRDEPGTGDSRSSGDTDTGDGDGDGDDCDREDVIVEPAPRDEPPVRREM